MDALATKQQEQSSCAIYSFTGKLHILPYADDEYEQAYVCAWHTACGYRIADCMRHTKFMVESEHTPCRHRGYDWDTYSFRLLVLF